MRPRSRGHRLQLKGVVAGGDHGKRDGAVGGAMKVLGFKPGAEPGIVDFGLALPEVGLKTALDAEMPELQFDVLGAYRKIAADVIRSDMQSGDTMTFALRFNHHRGPALGIG